MCITVEILTKLFKSFVFVSHISEHYLAVVYLSQLNSRKSQRVNQSSGREVGHTHQIYRPPAPPGEQGDDEVFCSLGSPSSEQFSVKSEPLVSVFL